MTVTNLCPPNWALPSDDGGWCNPPREHFDLSQPAYEQIAEHQSGIVPVLYREANSDANRPILFTINGNSNFNLVLVNSNSRWGTRSVSVKGSRTDWVEMSRNWGANWQANANLEGQALSFRVTDTYGRTLVCEDVMPANWRFGATYSAANRFQ